MKILRLTHSDRVQAHLHRAEAKMMHVVQETQVNLPVRPHRYNVREADGSLKKYTLFDTMMYIDTLKKIGGKYVNICRHIINH